MKGFVDHYKVTEVLKILRHHNHKIVVEEHLAVHCRHKKIPSKQTGFLLRKDMFF